MSQSGSILLFTLFVLVTVSIITLGYLNLFTQSHQLATAQEGGLKADLMARSGIEDAIYEIKRMASWPQGPTGVSPVDSQWQPLSGATLYKSTIATPPLTQVSYPATVSVQLAFSPAGFSGPVTINSTATITHAVRSFSSTYIAVVLRSLSGRMIIQSQQKQ